MRTLLVAFSLLLTGLAVVAPAPASANHCPVDDLLEPALDLLGRCRNRIPNPPGVACDTPVAAGAVANCSVWGSDPDGDPLWSEVDFGDGTSTFAGGFPSGGTTYTTHSWSSSGTYCVRARVEDTSGAWSAWSSCWMETVV